MLKLQDIYIFQDLDKELINFVIDNSKTIEFPAWEYVIKQWEKPDWNAYIIRDWIASLEIDGRKIKTFKKWDIFWEIALITDEPRTASILAITDLKLLKINKKLLHSIINDFPNGLEIQKIMMQRIIENTNNN